MNEARRNPEQNPKISAQQYVGEIYKKIPKKDRNDYFITFTSVLKIGVNPSTSWHTPIGIYSYQFSSFESYGVVDRDGNIRSFNYFPFAASSQFVTVFTLKNKRKKLFISQYSKKDLIRDIGIFGSHVINSGDLTPEELSEIYKESKNDDKWPFNVIWSYTMRVARELESVSKAPALWNFYLRKILGYDTIIDDKGYGIIHPNERFQTVSLSKNNINVIDTFWNNPKQEILDRKIEKDKRIQDNVRFIARIKRDFPNIFRGAKRIEFSGVFGNTPDPEDFEEYYDYMYPILLQLNSTKMRIAKLEFRQQYLILYDGSISGTMEYPMNTVGYVQFENIKVNNFKLSPVRSGYGMFTFNQCKINNLESKDILLTSFGDCTIRSSVVKGGYNISQCNISASSFDYPHSSPDIHYSMITDSVIKFNVSPTNYPHMSRNGFMRVTFDMSTGMRRENVIELFIENIAKHNRVSEDCIVTVNGV